MEEQFICIDAEDRVTIVNGEESFRGFLWGKNYGNYTFFKVENGGLTRIMPLTDLRAGQPYIEYGFDNKG